MFVLLLGSFEHQQPTARVAQAGPMYSGSRHDLDHWRKRMVGRLLSSIPIMASRTTFIVLAAVWSAAVCRAQTATVKIEPLPLRNFQMVGEGLYRGAQPTAAGFRQLARMGIHTVLDLRTEGGRATWEGTLVRSLGMQYTHVPLAGYQAPTPEQITAALRILQDAAMAPVFVHCRRGADRTGTIVALYRIVHDHWTNQQALEEARRMRMASREKLMEQLILQYHPQP
jgi:tyrosine-protein phosphatase SIW14